MQIRNSSRLSKIICNTRGSSVSWLCKFYCSFDEETEHRDNSQFSTVVRVIARQRYRKQTGSNPSGDRRGVQSEIPDRNCSRWFHSQYEGTRYRLITPRVIRSRCTLSAAHAQICHAVGYARLPLNRLPRFNRARLDGGR